MSYRFKTEHYEIGAQGRRHGALPAGARLASRRSARRPVLPELLRRAAREQVRQGRALGQRRRRAVRRLSVALLPRGRQRRLRPLRREVLRVLAPADPERVHAASSSSPTSGTRSSDLRHDRHLPRRVARPRTRRRSRPRTTSTTRSTSRRRRSSTGCSSSRTSSAWRTGSRTRVPFLDNDLVDFAQRLPVRLKLRDLEHVVG